MRITDCPNCGAEHSIEAALVIWLDDVVLDTELDDDGPVVVDFTPAALADDPQSGLVYDRFGGSDRIYVRCRECSHSWDTADFQAQHMPGSWRFQRKPNE